jgi:hypothetical protein
MAAEGHQDSLEPHGIAIQYPAGTLIVLPEISEQVLYVSAPSDSPLLGALAGSERVTERGTKAFYCFLDEPSN